ncbi:MAG: low temperature requirement protein A [Mycetocola sp.]
MSEIVDPRTTRGLSHRRIRMVARDPEESHRAATPLELLFDLTFVVAIGIASNELAHLLAEGHVASGLGAFAFAMFAICWAWINFSWFASAYDTDDWFYRITTMVQMIGVIVLALGLPTVFASLDEGEHLDNAIVVAGYVIMRVAMVAQWLRAAREDPARRSVSLTYAGFIILAQVGWTITAILDLSVATVLLVAPLLYLVELAGPVIAEQRFGRTAWHPHHIAERYALFTIIALGEGVIGTVVSVSAVIDEQGWSSEAILLVIAGTGLTFGLWWNYFVLPSGRVLARYRERSWAWGYGHMVIFASIAATGAGLHVAAYVIEGVAHIGVLGAVLSVAVPVLICCAALFVLYSLLLREFDPFHVALFVGTVLVLALAVVMAAAGVSMGVCLLVVMVAPAVVVVGYEVLGYRHQEAVLTRILGEPAE